MLSDGLACVGQVIMFMDEQATQQVKVAKGLGAVSEEDVAFATGRLVAEMTEPPFVITVETPLGETVEVETQARATVGSIKRSVEERCGIPAGRLELEHLGHRLTDRMTAAAAGLRAGSVVGHGVGTAYFWQGGGTLPISMELHAKNRRRLIEQFKPGSDNADVPANAHIVLQVCALQEIPQALCCARVRDCSPVCCSLICMLLLAMCMLRLALILPAAEPSAGRAARRPPATIRTTSHSSGRTRHCPLPSPPQPSAHSMALGEGDGRKE